MCCRLAFFAFLAGPVAGVAWASPRPAADPAAGPSTPRRSALARAKQQARTQYEIAERMREALNGRPASERTQEDYEKVMDAYRRVYHGAPTSTKAHLSVVAVAELLAEYGRAFNDEKALRDAIGQYEFLRREYPGSGERVEALLTIGEIYKEDLDDPVAAKSVFEEFLKQYPRSPLADQARQDLAELDREAKARHSKVKATKGEPGGDSRGGEKPARQVRVTGVRHWSTPDYTRVAVDLDGEVKYDAGRIEHPDRIYFTLHGSRLASTLVAKSLKVEDGFLRHIRVAQFTPKDTRVVLDLDEVTDYSAFLLPNPYRLIIDIRGNSAAKAIAGSTREVADEQAKAATVPTSQPQAKGDAKTADQPQTADKPAATAALVIDDSVPTSRGKRSSTPRRAQESAPATIRQAKPTSNGERSLVRALGLKIGRIVVDAGHGGHDTGTIGPNGLMEKDLVLDVALRLGKLLENLGADVVYTRDDDTFIPLETRTAIANEKQADLFISIHANSSPNPSARGVETYYLNFTSSEDALEVAARENAVSDKSIHELQDLVKKIALKDKVEESREFAAEVQRSLQSSLYGKTRIRDRGVRQAPFIVLIGANMPSVLAEISFVSNPIDARRLTTAAYRQKIAEAIYRGISKYVSGLGGLRVAAQKSPKD